MYTKLTIIISHYIYIIYYIYIYYTPLNGWFAYRDLVRPHLHLSDNFITAVSLPGSRLSGPVRYDEICRRSIRRHAMPLALHGGAPKIAKLVNITPISLWFIGDISIVKWVYNPFITGGGTTLYDMKGTDLRLIFGLLTIKPNL